MRGEGNLFGEKVLPPPDPPTFPKPFISVPDGCRDMKILLALPVLRQGLFVFGEGRSGRVFREDAGCFSCRTGCFPSCWLLGSCSHELACGVILKSTFPQPCAANAKSRERFHARGFCGPDTRQRLLPLLSFEPDGVGSAAAVRLEGKLAVKGGCCQAPIPSRRPALLRMRSMASSFRPLMVRRRSSSWAGS